MSLSLEEIIKKQAVKIDQLEVRISELEAENRTLHLGDLSRNLINF